MKFLLFISLFANLLFGGWILVQTQQQIPPGTVAARSDAPDPFPYQANSAENYYQQLLAAGIPAQQTKPLILAKLKQEHILSLAEPADHYWQNRPLAQTDYLLALDQGYAQVRAGLVRVYGAAATEEPLFSEIFYPLNMQYPFLDSAAQILVQRIQLETQRRGLELQQNSPDELMQLAEDLSPDRVLAEILSKESMQEYQLRASALAEQMRQSGVVFNEGSFRDIYQIIDAFQRNPSAEHVIATRQAVNDVLGQAEGLRLWAALDPRFAIIMDIAAQHSLDENIAMQAYALFLEASEKLLLAAAKLQDEPQVAGPEIQQILLERDNALNDLLGEAAAKELVREIGRNAM
ncbi:MAG: hypothetical protein GDA55_02215 [Cellvibrionales bacterium]|nr:hypothetical protein [Cellvibrionales bacterium]